MRFKDARLAFKPWTEAEIQRLRILATQGLPAKIVATRLGRTETALRTKARGLKIRFKGTTYFGDFDP
jgi:hypothetical protein